MPPSPQGSTPSTVHVERPDPPEVTSAFSAAAAAWSESIPESEREEKPAVVETKPAPVAPAEKPAPPLSKAAAAMFRREAEVRKQEQALAARVRELEARAAAPPKAPEKPPVNPKLDPAEYLRGLGLDPVAVSRFILSQGLGDKAPPEIQAQRDAYAREQAAATAYDGRFDAIRSELDRVRQENEQFRQVLVAREANKQFQDELVSFKPDEAEAPHAAHLYASDPDFFRAEVADEIRRDAAVRILVNGESRDAEAITHAEAVKRINARMAKYGGTPTSKSTNDPNLAGKKASAAKTRATPRVDETPAPSQAPEDDIWLSAAQGFLSAQ